jgi:hypothetical protein
MISSNGTTELVGRRLPLGADLLSEHIVLRYSSCFLAAKGQKKLHQQRYFAHFPLRNQHFGTNVLFERNKIAAK